MTGKAQGRRLVTTEQAAGLLEVRAALISQWKARGRVQIADSIRGRSRTGLVPLYDIEELRPLAEKYHATRRGRAGA